MKFCTIPYNTRRDLTLSRKSETTPPSLEWSSVKFSVHQCVLICNCVWPLFTKLLTLRLTCDLCNPFDDWYESTIRTNHLADYISRRLILGFKKLVNKAYKVSWNSVQSFLSYASQNIFVTFAQTCRHFSKILNCDKSIAKLLKH